MPIPLLSLIIHITINAIVVSPSLWISGRFLVGKGKAKFSDAIWIVVFGTVIGAIIGLFFRGFIASIVQLVLWLLLVQHFFNTGWMMALVISIIAVIIFVITSAVLGLIGITLITIL